MVQSFIDHLSETISKENEDPSNVLVVLPSRRAGAFLKKALGEAYQKTIFLPTILTFDDFVEELCEFEAISQIELFFELHDQYNRLLAEDKEQPEDLEQFLNWAPTLLSDFNDIERYEVNSLELFNSINDVRAIETWNIDGQPLTEQQKQYLALWKRIGKLFHRFKKELIAKNRGFAGLLFRYTSENISELIHKISYTKIYFAGFNALSISEENIIKKLVQLKLASVYFDADDYYVSDTQQEAGLFIRHYKENWNFTPINWIGNYIKTVEKEIRISSCSTSYAQALVCAQILEKHPGNELNTAIVLNKEDLLMPVLNTLPDHIDAVNITMGYPVNLSPIANFIDALITLWQNPKGKDKPVFYHRNVIDVIDHPYFSILYSNLEALSQLKKKIVAKNHIYIGKTFLQNALPKFDELAFIFDGQSKTLESCNERILIILSLLKEQLCAKTETNDSEEKDHSTDRSLLLEYLYHYTLVFRKISLMADRYEPLQNCSLALFKKLIKQLVNKEKISFLGEPLKGIQMMGLLETRALDFDHVILLSVNEGVLPSGKKNNSLIPYDVKKAFGLPCYQEQDAIFANHFYRLIQRAKKVDLIYQTSSDDFGAGSEKSRYIEQILYEFPKLGSHIKITENSYNPPPIFSETTVSITKSDAILSQIKKHLAAGLSPSALNKYLSCPLDYYYRYVVGLGEMDEMEEDIQSSTFGTCIHNTLEKLHRQDLKNSISPPVIKSYLKQANQILETEFLEFYQSSDLKRGKNLLTFEAAKKQVEKFLRYEMQLSSKEELIHLSCESAVEAELTVQTEFDQIPIKLKGKVDGILSVGGNQILLDYKTGKVEEKDLSLDSNKLFDKLSAHSKALQLLSYAYQYYKSHPEAGEISPCIFSFKNSSGGFIYLKLDGQKIKKTEVLELYPKVIQHIANDMLQTAVPFEHQSESKYCQYCPSV